VKFKTNNEQYMKIVSLDQVEKSKVSMEGALGAWKQLPLGSNENAPLYAFRVFTVEPEGHTPFHRHPYEHMNYVIEGQGILVNEKGEEKLLKAGDFALVDPNEKHQYRNKGNTPFKMICAVPKEFE
jgi:quercetin dioxygenase-like cupin family protein